MPEKRFGAVIGRETPGFDVALGYSFSFLPTFKPKPLLVRGDKSDLGGNIGLGSGQPFGVDRVGVDSPDFLLGGLEQFLLFGR